MMPSSASKDAKIFSAIEEVDPAAAIIATSPKRNLALFCERISNLCTMPPFEMKAASRPINRGQF